MKDAENLALRATMDLIQKEALKLLKENSYPADYIKGAKYAFYLIKRAFHNDDIGAIYDDYVKTAGEVLEEI